MIAVCSVSRKDDVLLGDDHAHQLISGWTTRRKPKLSLILSSSEPGTCLRSGERINSLGFVGEETSEAGGSSEEVAELEGEEVSSDGLNSFNYKSNTKSNTLN